MKLTAKMVLVIVIVTAVSALGFFGVFRYIVLESFIELDNRLAARNMDRCVAALQREIRHLDRFVHDWSSWDDTYQFALDANDSYTQANLLPQVFQDQKLNLIHIYDTNRRLVWGRAYDDGIEYEISLDLGREIASETFAMLLDQKRPGASTSGIVLTTHGVLVLSANPILTSENKGPSRGALVMGRFLSRGTLALLSEQLSFALDAFPVNRDSLPEEVRHFIETQKEGARDSMLFTTSRETHAYAMISDISGEPALALKATMPREILAEGKRAFVIGFAYIIGLVLLVLVMVALLLNGMVIKPVSRLTRQVLHAEESPGAAQDFDIDRNDEIGVLSREFGVLLGKLSERQKTLETSEERLRQIIEFLPDATFAVDRSGRIVAWNRAMEQITGLAHDEIRAQGHGEYTRLFYGEPRPVLLDLVLDEGLDLEGSYEFLLRDGNTVISESYAPNLYQGKGAYIWAIAAPFYDADGNIVGAIECIRDITERKKSEELLRRHSETIEQLLDGVVMTGLDGTVHYMNPSWAAMHGFEPGDITGEHISVFHTEDQMIDEVAPFLDEVKTKGSSRAHIGHITRNGTVFTTLTSAFLLKNPKGEPTSIIGIARDITDELKMESQLRQAQKLEVVGRLAGGVSHDLNNMLSPILGYAEIVLSDLPESNPSFDHVHQIKIAAERARNLIQELLAFSRKQVLDMKVVDLAEVVASYGKMLRRTIREDISIQVRQSISKGAVRVDVGQVGQVLMNLAVNAADAMPRGGAITIDIGDVVLDEAYAQTHQGVVPGDYVVMSVSDTGHGISPGIMEHIFEPFFTTKDKGKGTGLGLAMVYGIVRQHGGHISVYSERGMGSTFKVYLPRVEGAVESILSPSSVTGGKRGGETVVVAEDDAGVRELTCDILKKHGYRVITAETSQELLGTLDRLDGTIDMLLTDVIMPDMNGRVLYEKIRETHPGMKVLFMSGYTHDIISHHGILEEGVQLLQKPFSIAALTERIRQVLDA